MPIMLCSRDRCLWAYRGCPSVWRCWCGWASQLIKGLQRGSFEAHPSSFVTETRWESLTDFWGGNCDWGCGATARGGGRMGWRAHRQCSSGDINLASNTTAHQKKAHAPSLRLALYLPILFLLPVTKERGWRRPLLQRRGDSQTSPVSPLSHSLWAWHRKKEKWEPCWEKEG